MPTLTGIIDTPDAPLLLADSAPVSAFALVRIGGFDLLRIVAAVGIVFFHLTAGPSKIVGYTGLPIFLLIMYVLVLLPSKRVSFGRFTVGRAKRLILPWCFWSFVYIAAKLFMHREDLFAFEIQPRWYLVGGYLHLWFLPFAMVTSLLCFALLRHVGNESLRMACVTATGVGFLAMVIAPYAMKTSAVPIGQWCFALPALPIALAITLAARIRSTEGVRSYLVGIGVVMTVAAIIGVALGHGLLMALPYVLAIWLVIACVVIPVGRSPRIEYLAALTFGVYLVHPLVNWTLIKFFGIVHSGATHAAIVAVLSFVLIALMRVIKPLRVVI